jgi:peptide/nickel transport system permease protein
MPLLFVIDGTSIDLERRLEPPSADYLLGTDENGRDVLARLLEGGRISLFVGFGAGLLASAIGTVIGFAAGWFGRFVSALLMRFTDIAIAFPSILVLLLAAALLGRGPERLLLIISFTLWTSAARVIRGRVLEIKEAAYIDAAVAIGVSPLRLFLRHILPNMQETVAVTAVLAINHAVLNESIVSFLGLGIRPPASSWGTMLSNAQSYFFRGSWLIIAPGLAIMITLLATYAIANRLTLQRRANQV